MRLLSGRSPVIPTHTELLTSRSRPNSELGRHNIVRRSYTPNSRHVMCGQALQIESIHTLVFFNVALTMLSAILKESVAKYTGCACSPQCSKDPHIRHNKQ